MAGVELAIRDLDFEAAVQVERPAEIRLSGNADGSIVTELTSLISTLHSHLVESHRAEVTVDIRTLEFMNATCFNVLVSWLTLINELPPEQRYLLRFAINTAIPWQRRSLRTLSCFATDLVQVVD